MTRATRRLARVFLMALCAVVSRAGAEADPPMQFRFDVQRGMAVIWLYGPIGPDSARNVERGLRQTARYREVWLDSGGGSVSEGYAIGRLLRELKATVRVPAQGKVMCASSCTNLMLGGYNRIVENGAQFYVHAMSKMLNLSDGTQRIGINVDGRALSLSADTLIEEAGKKPEVLRAVVEQFHAEYARSSVDLLRYFQGILGGSPNEDAYQRLVNAPVAAMYGPPSARRAGARDLASDAASLRDAGVIALQEIMTQTELDAMRGRLALAREREAELGRGARVAARLFEATLACRIQDVCLLTRHELANLGYHNFDPQ
ncbi:hypothetical protein ACKI2N_030145 [Cupriavidus sp. 30B13]|uniref:hypothetical protein n=1 Tax=Cupriavidus sp. 30B13 TaxID=3384241 RepID=UPI003B91D2DD